MQLNKFLKFLLIVFSVIFLGLQYLTYELEAAGMRAVIIFLLTLLYINRIKEKQLFFLLFLVTFTAGELTNFMSYFVPKTYDFKGYFSYYLTNSLFILAFMFLIIRIVLAVNVRKVIRKFPFHFIVLLILNVYCVTNITETSATKLTQNQYIFEFVYNGVIMVLLSMALMNFVYKDDKKSMNLLLGSIFIVFSEFLQLTYFYILKETILNVVCSLFYMLGFLFLYLQARLPMADENQVDFKDIYA